MARLHRLCRTYEPVRNKYRVKIITSYKHEVVILSKTQLKYKNSKLFFIQIMKETKETLIKIC